jgi:hypothetical protein
MRNSLHYFKISQENLEPHLDKNYFIIQKDAEINEYIKNVKNIKEILITIKKLKQNKEDKGIVEKYFQKLFNSFNEFSNCSELGCFVNACDTTRDLVRKDYDSFKKITDLFIKHRILDDKTPENWIQAILDSNASRKKAELGQKKLVKILCGLKYKQIKNWGDFYKNKKCVAIVSKGQFSTEVIKEKLKIRIDMKNEEKMLDLLIKNNKKIFILEAKHLNVGGGEQDKQIGELLKILELEESKKDLSYISFLDGTYSNKLISMPLSKRATKMRKEKNRIEKY